MQGGDNLVPVVEQVYPNNTLSDTSRSSSLDSIIPEAFEHAAALEVLDQHFALEERILVDLLVSELRNTKELLIRMQNDFESSVRGEFLRNLCLELKVSLGHYETFDGKWNKRRGLSVADRISARVLLLRAGLNVFTADPVCTITGIKRSISLPQNCAALTDISRACFPEEEA